MQDSYAQQPELTVETKVVIEGRLVAQNTVVVGDRLFVTGTSIPSDALIAELYNPRGALVSRTQIDADQDGNFEKEILRWTVPTQNLPYGTYSLVVKSTLNEERRVTEALKFQLEVQQGIPTDAERELAVQISVPANVGINENVKVIVQVTINNILVKGDPRETLKDSHIHFPDGTVEQIDTFTGLEDGIYTIDFSSRLLGHHTIHVEAFQEGLIANSVSGVLVQESSFSSLGKEVSDLNANIEGLRQETVEKTEELTNSVSRIESASGQVTSLLLPIIGMIAIIVALQATMLARRK